jgi:hypothetical protein
MLLTLTCTAPDAPDLGHLLQKHPDSVFERDFSAGKVWVFYPEVAQDRVTVALLIEVDPVGLGAGRRRWRASISTSTTGRTSPPAW